MKETEDTPTTGRETIRLVEEWLKLGLPVIQAQCFPLLIEDEWESETQKLNARLDAIACVGIEKILELIQITKSRMEEEENSKQPLLQLVK